MASTAGFLVVLLALAFLAESTTEYIFGPFLDATRIRYVALAVGMALTLAFKLNAFKVFFGLETDIPYVGEIVTGLIIGRGSNFLHDFYKTYIEGSATPVPSPPTPPSG